MLKTSFQNRYKISEKGGQLRDKERVYVNRILYENSNSCVGEKRWWSHRPPPQVRVDILST